MGKSARQIYYNILGLLTVLCALLLYTILYIENFEIQDIALFIILFMVLAFTFRTSLSLGLIVGMVVVFCYASVVGYQAYVGSEFIWSLNYTWFFAYPLSIFLAGRIEAQISFLIRKADEAEQLTDRLIGLDSLTGFGNGKEFLKDLNIEMSRARRYSLPLTLMIAEIQYFRELKDIYGIAGTKSIYEGISEGLALYTRTEDLKFRIDEDKLAIVLTHTAEPNAEVVKSRLKEHMEHLKIEDKLVLNQYSIHIKVGYVDYSESMKSPMEFKEKAIRELEYDV